MKVLAVRLVSVLLFCVYASAAHADSRMILMDGTWPESEKIHRRFSVIQEEFWQLKGDVVDCVRLLEEQETEGVEYFQCHSSFNVKFYVFSCKMNYKK